MYPRNETLVRLLSTGAFDYDCNDICSGCKYAGHIYCEEEKLADYLIVNGVEPVKYGHWEMGKNCTDMVCSYCSFEVPYDILRYCPNCGAQMY